MRVRIHPNSPLLALFPRWVAAFVLGRRIFLRGRLTDFSEEALRHELIHVGQYLELGVFRFLWCYFLREWRLAYRQKSFEREAYDHQGDPEYLWRRWPQLRLEILPPGKK